MYYAAIPGMKLYHAQVKFYYADTMLTRASHVTYHVTNVEVCSSSEPETELGVATSATAPSLLDRLRCLLGLNYQEIKRLFMLLFLMNFQNALSCQHYAKMLLASIMLKIMLALSAKAYS